MKEKFLNRFGDVTITDDALLVCPSGKAPLGECSVFLSDVSAQRAFMRVKLTTAVSVRAPSFSHQTSVTVGTEAPGKSPRPGPLGGAGFAAWATEFGMKMREERDKEAGEPGQSAIPEVFFQLEQMTGGMTFRLLDPTRDYYLLTLRVAQAWIGLVQPVCDDYMLRFMNAFQGVMGTNPETAGGIDGLVQKYRDLSEQTLSLAVAASAV